LSEEIKRATLRDRVFTLISECDAAVALPGGVGTLLEIITLWNNLLIKTLTPRPMLLIGSGWKSTFEIFFQTMDPYVLGSHRELVAFVPDIESAVTAIEEL
jgi:predicted Rossmann-fold nucleotide-binding protein